MRDDAAVAAVPAVEARGGVKSLGPLRVLRGVSLAIPRGASVAIVGPSGSGKTTLLRCMNLLEEFEAGEMLLEGEPIGYGPAPRRRRLPEREIARARAQIGMVFQSFNLFPHMSVLRNVTVAPVRIRRSEEHTSELQSRQYIVCR